MRHYPHIDIMTGHPQTSRSARSASIGLDASSACRPRRTAAIARTTRIEWLPSVISTQIRSANTTMVRGGPADVQPGTRLHCTSAQPASARCSGIPHRHERAARPACSMSGLRRCGRERTHDTCLVVRRVPRLLTDHMTEFPLVRAPRIPVTETFHGAGVTEDYRWLEDASSEETIAWAKAQQHRSCTYFGGIPWRDALRARAGRLLKSERTTYKRLLSGGKHLLRAEGADATAAAVPGGADRP
jgi:hypothetical protein